ncbi:adhesion G protein-coupled receptor E3-like [Chanos chanos]|uniref:Adhesion G protein-coupled receptor E3-like n=1 Tax=Chanos chanos TaxID=29144 RepID=A0A6J2VP66_CHACN|nr:adhesion G protein-coupled receptor E3-like [Chanos chanos]
MKKLERPKRGAVSAVWKFFGLKKIRRRQKTRPHQAEAEGIYGQNWGVEYPDSICALKGSSRITAQLDEELNTLERKSDKSSESVNLASQASTFLNNSETLVSSLVKATDTEELLNFTSNTTEVKVYTVGPNATVRNILRLSNTAALMDIDIISIAKNNKGHASAAFMTYDNMLEILKPTFFPSKKDTVNTMMSTVVSAFLPKTTNKTLTNPVNFTLKHIIDMDPAGTLYCVYWDKTEWSTNGCVRISEENSNDTICSCTHLSTFALLMQTEKLPEWSHRLELLNTIAFAVGLTLLSLAVLTFILFRKNSRVSSVLRLNLCICLLLAQLLFLLTQRFLAHSNYKVLACAVFVGILHFLFLSAFMWMFLEAITLFISVMNLSKIKSRRREVLQWKYQLVIGYVVPTLVVGISVAVQRDGYDSETCWIKLGTSFVWSFLGPVCFILAVNLILFITIIITLQCTLMHLSGDVSQIKTSRTMVFKALAQFFILGCPWIMGFSTNISEGAEIIFLLLTSQQGTFIFLVHCVLNKEVKQKQFQKSLNFFSMHMRFECYENVFMSLIKFTVSDKRQSNLDSRIYGQNWGVAYPDSNCVLKGSSVNMSCSYTYPNDRYGQSYIINNIQSNNSGLYYCEAQNKHGSQRTTAVPIKEKAVAAALLAYRYLSVYSGGPRASQARKASFFSLTGP